MKKQVWALLAVLSLGGGLGWSTATASAKTTYLPKTIRSHTWYYTASGTEGGFHERTTFKKNALRLHMRGAGTYTWRFSKVKKHSSKVYYAHVNYGGGNHDQVKIKLVGKKEFLIISKHQLGTQYSKKAYAGTADYGAKIFKR
ncbi:hypothetical protein [Lactiplantibacillus songbeiensis]|uniref:Extracellular protein n=1 Tax=Lactiplantibacillus songbeiensis TaxID=2559920 RepID=A0ABW4C318_9LACO|nr:hypothetical protein [Lactiplantibacillus songbeiensis]